MKFVASPAFWGYVVAVVAASACAPRADFAVVRPAEIDYDLYEDGHRVELGQFVNGTSDGRGARVAQQVRMELQNSGAHALGLDKDLELVGAGGGLVVSGRVTRLDVEQSREEERDSCNYRQEGQEGPFEAMETWLTLAPEDEGSRLTARSRVSLGLPLAALTDRIAAWKRRGELERALENIAVTVE